jgi:hypothetical protein
MAQKSSTRRNPASRAFWPRTSSATDSGDKLHGTGYIAALLMKRLAQTPCRKARSARRQPQERPIHLDSKKNAPRSPMLGNRSGSRLIVSRAYPASRAQVSGPVLWGRLAVADREGLSRCQSGQRRGMPVLGPRVVDPTGVEGGQGQRGDVVVAEAGVDARRNMALS